MVALWRVAAPLAFATAGILFATSAGASRGADLRGGARSDLPPILLVDPTGKVSSTPLESTQSAVRRPVWVASPEMPPHEVSRSHRAGAAGGRNDAARAGADRVGLC